MKNLEFKNTVQELFIQTFGINEAQIKEIDAVQLSIDRTKKIYLLKLVPLKKQKVNS